MGHSKGEILIALIGYMVVVAIIGVISFLKTKDVADFAIGGRRLNWQTTALSTHASGMSGWLLLGLPGLMYVTGADSIWIVIGLIVGAGCAWMFIAKRLRLSSAGYEDDAITLPQFFLARTGSQSLAIRLVPPIVILVFYTIYLASGFIASAKLIEFVLGWSYQQALLAGISIIMVYVAIGGFLAASWTDTFQGTLMIIALVTVATFASQVVSPEFTIELTQEINLESTVAIVSLIAWGLGYLGQPHILARFMAINSADDLNKAAALGLGWMVICLIAAAAIGILGADIAPEIEDSEKIYLYLAQFFLNPWIAGIVIAAILAAIMSTVDSQLVVSSAAITQDLGLGISKGVFVNRITVILLCIFAGMVAYDPQSILDVVALAWAGLGASFGPPLLFCLFWKKTSPSGVVSGVLAGSTVTLLWNALTTGILAGVYEIIPAFLASTLAVWIVSYLTPSEVARARAITKYGVK